MSRPARMAARRSLRTGLGIALVAVAIALATGEAVVRLFGHGPPDGLFTVTTREFDRIPGIYQPNQSVIEAQGTRFAHRASVDSLGYRGKDFPRAKPPGEFRILYVGDSFTWGHNVGDAETLPAQMESLLGSRCASARVINAGISGTTIAGQDRVIERGIAVEPDAVILMYHENDIDELMRSRVWDELAENRRIKSRFPLSVVYPIVRRSALWNLAQSARRSLRFRSEQLDAESSLSVEVDSARLDAARDEYRERLAASFAMLSARNTPLLYVLYPHPTSVTAGRGGRDYEWAYENAVRLGLTTVDLLHVLRSSELPVTDLFLLPEDYHPSAKGYSLAADHLALLMTGSFAGTRCSAT